MQLRFPGLTGCANSESLLEAQATYRAHGVANLLLLPREAQQEKWPLDPDWYPIDDLELFEGADTWASAIRVRPFPEDLTSLDYWRANYWRAE